MTEPLVVTHDLTRLFSYGLSSLVAVCQASCTVHRRDRIALTGPSGSGKSTFLHLLGGLDGPSSGDISWPGIGSVGDLRPIHIVDIFQGPSLLPPLTTLENVSLPLLLAGSGQEAATDDALQSLSAFDVAQLRDALPSELSGGQVQRVAIARAFAGNPSLILADEPTGQQDSHTAIHVLNTMLELAKLKGSSILVSTHDPNVARMLDRQWSMHDGFLETDEPTGVSLGSAVDHRVGDASV